MHEKELLDSIEKLFDKGKAVLFRWKNDAYWSVDYVSKNIQELLNYSNEEFLSSSINYIDCIYHEDLAGVKSELALALAESKEYLEHTPYRLLTKDNRVKWVLDQTLIQRDKKGEITHYIGHISDITKTVELSEENKILQERAELALKSTDDGVWDWNIKRGEAFFSLAWKAMLGYEDSDIQNRAEAFFELIHPDDIDRAKDAIATHFKDASRPYEIELRLLCKNGTYKWILSRGKVLLDAKNTPYRMLGLHADISHQKEVEARLKESEFRWKFAIEGSGDGLWDWNIESGEVYYSPQWKSMLGYEDDEIESSIESWKKLLHKDQKEILLANLQEYIEGKKEKYISEHQLLCKDGSYKWILDRGIFVSYDESEKPLRMIGTHTDIDKQKRTQEQLNLLNQRFNNMFEKHNAIMLLIDPKSEKIIDANLSAQKFYGYSLEEFKTLKISDINMASKEEVSRSKEEAFNGEKNCFIFTHKKKNSQLVTIETHTSSIETQQGDILFSIIVDITKEKENEKQLREVLSQLQQAQKIAKIGLWELQHKRGLLTWSAEVYNIFELDSKSVEASYELFMQKIHPSDRDEVTSSYQESLISKEPYEITHRALMPDGRIKYLLEQCDTLFDEDGAPLVSRGTVQDITEFHILDKKVREERERFRSFMDSASDGIFILNQDLKLLDYSRVAKEMLGYSDKEMLNLSITDWDVRLAEEELHTLIDRLTSTPTTFETIHKRKDGTTYNASISAVIMTLEGERYIYAAVRDISEIKRLQNRMLHEKNFIETIIESSNAVVAVIDSEGRMIKLNRYAEEFTGYTQEEISQEPYKWSALLPMHTKAEVIKIVKDAKRGNILKSFQNEWCSKSGEIRLFEWSNTLVKKEDGSMDYIATIGIDISKNEEQQALLNLLINSQSHMIVLADGEELKYVNQSVLEFFDSATLEALQERYRCICESFVANDFSFHLGEVAKDEEWVDAIRRLPKEKQIVTIYSQKDGVDRTFRVNIENYDKKKMYIMTLIDISDSLTKQFELEYKSYHDPLTHAYNRSYLYDNWERLRTEHKESWQLTGVAMVDIDYFKTVNDTYGHDVGDAVLKKLVDTIIEYSRKSDTLVRWGGEEFVLLIPIKSAETLYKMLDTLRERISQTSFALVGSVRVSIGASISYDLESLEELIKSADSNLYISKESGRDRVTL